MFLESMVKRNPQLIVTACELHRKGLIPPNTYVIDKDAVFQNARIIADSARKHGLGLYFMTKQIGRNPELADAISKAGIDSAVAVDYEEAQQLHGFGIRLGHVGHLVQVPSGLIEWVISVAPEVVTCFSVDKARELSEAAVKAGTRQNILLRVVSRDDFFYPMQSGGIAIEELPRAIEELKKLPGIQVVGVTSFPCLIMDNATREPRPTPNVNTMLRAASILRDAGVEVRQINGPSMTCASTMGLLKSLGISHAEPGHSLTGTTPLHAVSDQPEIPAMVYVSEVSHVFKNEAYVFGGGFYARSHLKEALVGNDPDTICERRFRASQPRQDHIDYYLPVRVADNVKVGDTAIFAFRTQIFVTRSYVAVVEGISGGNPHLTGLYDSRGNLLRKVQG
ncbi:MAG: YhfX family PLP-dependent enzyme [Candidatus Fermentithermobacillus carboniphilus]|uniref:YhfX family PLP-dependent enzyme n=1 Tax=Candidatus Fermentithermobacillus carboniphilus TaxID=3085328 RepID=A0AAT9LEY7_9FIRM|nr:MAG: YhfX family PLP-dependent enzyme [Candidatus Fermentithermobacillus carboniphilus]